MLKVEETLDISLIENIRKACKSSLDNYDSLSWHAVLKEGEKILGIARFYLYNGGIMAEEPYLLDYDKINFEMLFRSVLFKAMSTRYEYAYVKEVKDYYRQFGFKEYGDIMRVKVKDIKFPDLCGGCKND